MTSQLVLPKLARPGHASHCNRCIQGLGPGQTEYDTSRLCAHGDRRMAVGFYCIASLDVLGLVESKMKEHERDWIREWIWAQQIERSSGAGFRSGTAVAPAAGISESAAAQLAAYDPPDLIMTYTSLLLLSILRDDFARLKRTQIARLLAACQTSDGSFTLMPGEGDADLRTTYCAFAIASMLDDWSGIDVPRAIAYIRRCQASNALLGQLVAHLCDCQTWEGGFGQDELQEAVGGTTYCALAALALAPVPHPVLSPEKHSAALRWLILKQRSDEGFCGRTNKEADACYSFWCGAALAVLGHADLIDRQRNAAFIARCQFKFGGIAKAPGEHPDPFHTYMSVACLSIYPPYPDLCPGDTVPETDVAKASWAFASFDPVLNATTETAAWARRHIPQHSE
ncbi:terpenoid cyclases/Protein prenyltransferase [Auriculariales sp. MPI-PUGE-AT-0066]|nr:terpenoid cyclases/Protein prenyltransferase [Auriculariales sp. MPI-PUGE-AT-0066]